MLRKAPLGEEAVARAVENPGTRRIISLCIDHARPVKEISEKAGLPLASAYRQVKQLVEDGVLVVERSAMTRDGKPFDLFRSRVRTAAIQIVPGAVKVTWETNASVEDRLASLWGHLGG